MGVKYKLLILSPLFMTMPSCVSYKNVVKDKTDTKMLLVDTETHEERIFDFDGYTGGVIKYVYPGDTIKIACPKYQRKKVIEFNTTGTILYTNTDSVCTRYEREKLEYFKQQMQQEKVR